jgi:hypothetical protein
MATSHHGSPASNEPQMETMRRLLDQFENKARREYPQGRMGADDDGALSYAVAADKKNGTVVINFGKPVVWLGLAPADVAKLVQCLIAKAKEVAKEPFTVEI